MQAIIDKQGELKLSAYKIFVMSLIVLFFTAVAKTWEGKRRREFKRAVGYKDYTADDIRKIIADFKELTSCRDPYIENFYIKHPDFAGLHKLWVLNSSGYWVKKLERRLCSLNNEKYIVKPVVKEPAPRKKTLLERIDDRLVNYFGNHCEVRSLDFFLKWGKSTENKHTGKLNKKLFNWFTKYYAGFVVPTDGALGRGNAVMPYENILELVKRAKVGQIWPCSCKSFRPTNPGVPRATCMLIAEVASLDDSVTKYPDMGHRPAEEIIQRIKECEDAGLLHQIMCVSNPGGRKMYVLCNCDNKACVPMFLKCRYDIPMVRSSGFVCVQGDLIKCTGCGKCASRCMFSAIKMDGGKPLYDPAKCLGCGLCVTTCEAGIRKMERQAREPIHEYTAEQIKNHPERTVITEERGKFPKENKPNGK